MRPLIPKTREAAPVSIRRTAGGKKWRESNGIAGREYSNRVYD